MGIHIIIIELIRCGSINSSQSSIQSFNRNVIAFLAKIKKIERAKIRLTFQWKWKCHASAIPKCQSNRFHVTHTPQAEITRK